LLGNNEVDKLCIIHLFKADLNFNNKWLGNKTIVKAKKQDLIAKEQYGSRKANAAITQCLNKCLWYNYIWFCCWPAALCLNDAKRCYD